MKHKQRTKELRAMKNIYRSIAALIVLIVSPVMAQTNSIQKYEYWLDGQFNQRVTTASSESVSTTIDAGALSRGIHTLCYRVQDADGLWSSPSLKYFVRSEENTYPGNEATKYEYWIDGKYEQRQSGTLSSGKATMTLSMPTLSKGVHTLAYRINDKYEHWSSPELRYFVVPDSSLVNNKIVAYEYFFNHGHAVHVDVTPGNPVSQSDIWIEVKNVVPNEIPADYVFDVNASTAWCKDSVSFGLRCIDALTNSSAATMSSKFFMNVPVNLNYISLTDNQREEIVAPEAGEIVAFKLESGVKDTLMLEVENGSCTLDFYDKAGKKLTSNITNDGKLIYSICSEEGGTVYALLHHASVSVLRKMAVTLTRGIWNSISSVTVGEGLHLTAEKGLLTVVSSTSNHVTVIDELGRIIVEKDVVAGKTSIPLLSKIYLIRTKDGTVKKIYIP